MEPISPYVKRDSLELALQYHKIVLDSEVMPPSASSIVETAKTFEEYLRG